MQTLSVEGLFPDMRIMAINHDATPAGSPPGGRPTLLAWGSVPPFPEPAVGYFGLDVLLRVTAALSHIILTEDIALCHPVKAPCSPLSLLEAFARTFHPSLAEKPARSSSGVRSFMPSAVSPAMAVGVTGEESLQRAIGATLGRRSPSHVLGEPAPGFLQSFVFGCKATLGGAEAVVYTRWGFPELRDDLELDFLKARQHNK